MEKKKWFYVALGGLIASILLLFTSIISYEMSGSVYRFNIIDLIFVSDSFRDVILQQYQGPLVLDVPAATVSVLAVIAVGSMICSVTGLITLRAQRPNTRQFILTIIGLVGVSIPSLVVIVCVAFFGEYYTGTLRCGIAPIITPIVMVISILAVIRRRNKVLEQMRAEMEAKGMIRQAGDML